jgi:hypothetical protein
MSYYISYFMYCNQQVLSLYRRGIPNFYKRNLLFEQTSGGQTTISNYNFVYISHLYLVFATCLAHVVLELIN